LNSNLTLEAFDSQYQKDALNINNNKNINPEMIAHFESIFNSWSESIETTLEEAEAEKKEDKDAGPRQELEYWK